LLDYYGGQAPKGSDTPPTHFMSFLQDYPHLVPYRTEWLIYDDTVKMSGSIDMVYENVEDGTLSIYDWKRCKSIDKTNGWNKFAITECISHLPDSNFWHYALQLNTYKTILERNYGKRVADMYLVRLHPDSSTYQLLKVPVLENEMNDLFELKKSFLSV
jgi:ATP-dependent exoDNAse (exonuclease V) beta subunit